jgi:membrane-associated protease RseP (regulator of RpoE activity)
MNYKAIHVAAALLILAGVAGATVRSEAAVSGRSGKPAAPKGETTRGGGQGWLGVFIEAPGPLTRSTLGLSEDEGLVITGTSQGSAAEKAGLSRGDVLLKVDGAPVNSEGDVRGALRGKAGQSVKLDLLRAGKPLSIELVVGDRAEYRSGEAPDEPDVEGEVPEALDAPDAPDLPDVRESPSAPDPGRDITILIGGGAYLGVEPQNLGRELADAFGVPDGKGVLLARVIPGGPAARAGLKTGDVLVKFDGHALETASDLRRDLRQVRGRKTVHLVAVRKGETREFNVELSGGHGRNQSQVRIPDFEQWRLNFGEGDREHLQTQMRELRDELRELKEQIRALLQREK